MHVGGRARPVTWWHRNGTTIQTSADLFMELWEHLTIDLTGFSIVLEESHRLQLVFAVYSIIS
jgi:hypothetical protein